MTTVDLLDQIVGKLSEVRPRCPEFRFGQLLATIGMLAEDETGHSLWDVEDADFLAALERFAADLAHRGSGSAEPGAVRDGNGITAAAASPASQPPRQVS